MDTVLFYKNNGKYYYRFVKGKAYNLNSENLFLLNNVITYPCKFIFDDLSLFFAQNILNYFDNEWIDINIQEVSSSVNRKKYAANIDYSNNYMLVPVYKILDRDSLNMVNGNVNPYLFDFSNSRLLEIDRVLTKGNLFRECYFLDKDLDDSERELLAPKYTELMVNYIYSYNNDVMNYSKNKKVDNNLKILKK